MQQDNIERPWDQREGEPKVWYEIFTNYYLPLGNRRSLRTAFEFFLRVENPLEYSDEDPENITRIPGHWSKFAADFEWASRAMEYDQAQMPDLASQFVRQTLDYLRSNANTAARALVKALSSDRTRVQAANSILNRAGVPEVSELRFTGDVSITSDDMAAASARVNEWNQTKKQSG